LTPGDLSVFLAVALQIVDRQDTKDLVEILVVPDCMPEDFCCKWDSLRRRWSHLPLRLVALNTCEHALLWLLRHPIAVCFHQFYAGVKASCATHLLWHDADLFLLDPAFMRSRFEACSGRKLACVGSSPTPDKWFTENGITHVVDTWELMMDVSWIRSFPPWQHRGHEDVLKGTRRKFDITQLPQCHTQPGLIHCDLGHHQYVHLCQTICTFRWFSYTRAPYEDRKFRLLFIRLLLDALEGPDSNGRIPSLTELQQGFRNPAAAVTYLRPAREEVYQEFRREFERLIQSCVLGESASEILHRSVAPFDRRFGWNRC
jgi:hypothetical protein